MKALNLFALLAMSVATSAYAAGGITSNGPVGQELMNCQGGFKFSPDNLAEVTLTVAPVLGQGLVAKVVFSKETRIPVQKRKVEKRANDPRGLVYEGSKIDILVPAMQAPNRPGRYQAILQLGDFSQYAAILDCTKQ